MQLLKKFASKLPAQWQDELKRIYFARKIRKDSFGANEPEYKILEKLIKPGDWVIDIGANVGHYTQRFSTLVGPQGRVIAFEPVPATFALLAANVQLLQEKNVTLFNTAVSDSLDIVGMSIPKFSSGLGNYYQAQITRGSNTQLNVLAIELDSLAFKHSIALVKIDAEGHESLVISGMRKLIELHLPTLIVENPADKIIEDLESLNYKSEKLSGSPNILFLQQGQEKQQVTARFSHCS